MATADDAGPVALRVDLPVGAGRTFAAVYIPLLALGIVVSLGSRGSVPAVYAVIAAPIVVAVGITIALLKRKPTAVEVREKGLVIHCGSRVDVVDWPKVKGIEQVIIGMVPTHVVLFHGRKRLLIGAGDRAVALAQEIVRRAGLRWLHEPFSAAR
jgi:hypothetical protein